MMTTEWTSDGFALTVRPHGVGRFFSATFLLVWLTGWAIGEAVALGLLGWGSWSLLTGMPPRSGATPLEPGPALAMGAFLLVWVAFWTLGGWAAGSELLRLVSSEDRLVARPSGLLLVRRRGPFRSREEFPRDRLRRIYRLGRSGSIRLQTATKTVDFADVRGGQEIDEALRTLRRQAGLAEEDDTSASLPAGWQELVTPEGARALVRDMGVRRLRSRVAVIASLGAGGIAALLVAQASGSPRLVPIATLFSLFALAIVAGTVWLLRGRIEHAFGEGRIVVRRRFGDRLDDLFEGHGLALTHRSDSDGDDWYTLEILGRKAGRADPSRRKVVSSLHDPTEPRALGRWLAARTGLPLDDAMRRRGHGWS